MAREWKGCYKFYDVKSNDVELIESDTVIDNKSVGMRVLVGTNEQHGLYILTKTSEIIIRLMVNEAEVGSLDYI